MIGSTIGHYTIEEKLGEGGMGVVYKAQDMTLNRAVALKFLPDRVNNDAGAKERFLQEAQAAGSLNHPNICTIFGAQEHEGQLFISMEYVVGGTLRERLPFQKVNDALAIALQIGEALDEAHTHGIVHRDVKADNIMLTAKGQAKVMDFGLAKLKGALKLTRTSSTVGTLGYMAPEQIQGGMVDHRSDIFSFGVLLFEMLTGKLPFRGEHEAAMVYSIVNEQPETLKTYLPDASAELMRMIARSLEKDPEDRYQSAADMVSELRHFLKQSSRLQRSTADIPFAPVRAHAATASVAASWNASKKWWAIGGGTGFLVIGALLSFSFFQGTNAPGAQADLNPNMTIRVLPIPFTQFSYPGISSDGNWVAFPAANTNTTWDFYYMHAAGTEARRVTFDSISSGINLQASISPDGSLIAYQGAWASDGSPAGIYVISSLGGPSKRVARGASLPRWRPDGQRIGYILFNNPSIKASYNLWSVRPDGSDERVEYSDTIGTGGRNSRYSFNWSPDGRSIVWIRSSQDGSQEVITRDLESQEERQLTFDKKNVDDVAWLKNGHIAYSSNRGGNTNLWLVPVGGGTPQQLTKGSGPDIGLSVSANDQKLVYLQQQQLGSVWVANLATNRTEQVTFDDRQIHSLALSPDGRRLVFTMGDIDPLKPGLGLYVQDRSGSSRRPLIPGPTAISSVVWSPDGKHIAFSMNHFNAPSDSASIYIMNPADPGEPRRVTRGIRATWLTSNKLAVTRGQQTGRDVVTHDEIYDLQGGKPVERLGDSLAVVGRLAGNKVLLQDRHQARFGYWVVQAEFLTEPAKILPKKLTVSEGSLIIASSTSVYELDAQNRVWKINPATGQRKQVSGSFAGLDYGPSVEVSSQINLGASDWRLASGVSVDESESELAFVAYRISAKLVMIEDIFK